jgi:multiple sugar transport system substrate-binding protein
MTTQITRRTLAKTGLAAAAITGLAACNGGGDAASDGGGGGDTLTVWTPHNTPQRLAVQEAVAARFTEETGIAVSLVGMDGGDMNTSIVAGAASGDVPDVALVAVDQVASWFSQGLIDPAVAEAVVGELDASTFSEDALGQVTLEDQVVAVPSDSWGELLYYRTDVFEEHGLSAPQTVQDVVAAAQTISEGDSGMVGIVLGTTPADPLTREHVEYLGLANGAQMFEGTEVTLDSPANVENFTNYQALAEASVTGDQETESTRAAYLNGDAAMVLWSPHLLDEIANLDENFPVTVAEAAEDPLFLAKNTAVVGGLAGVENSEPTTLGSVLAYVCGTGSNAEAAQQYIQFLLSDGYIDTLAMTPEGRTPVRTGTPENPTQYVDEWAELPIGTNPDNQMPLAEAFSDDAVEQISTAANVFGRWGFGTENWATAGAAVAQNTVVLDLQNLLPDGDPQAYADSVQAAVEQLHSENQ